jgi:ubiquinone/menaquinone biosynthesis C-methylase UbiE
MISADTPPPDGLMPESIHAWNAWQAVVEGRAHIGFQLFHEQLDQHLDMALQYEVPTMARLAAAWSRPEAPVHVLDIGCSVGLKAFAIQQQWPDAHVVGIDPDLDAVAVGRQLADDPWMRRRLRAIAVPEFIEASAESLPYADDSCDLVVCLTVIEHVRDVSRTVREISRVLAPGGVAYIEAPNYLWPVESHLHVVTPPLAPKWLMRWCARIQGMAAHAEFVDHLQLVNPFLLERLFRANRLAYTNIARAKLDAAAAGDSSAVVAYMKAARLLAALRRFGLARPLASVLGAVGMYPSLMYRLQKIEVD